MASGRVHEAVRVLEKAQALKPHDDDVRVFLGMALRLANHGHHARAVLATMAQDTSDTPVVRLARGLCELPDVTIWHDESDAQRPITYRLLE